MVTVSELVLLLVIVLCGKLAHFFRVTGGQLLSVAAGYQNFMKCSFAQLTLQHCFHKYTIPLKILFKIL